MKTYKRLLAFAWMAVAFLGTCAWANDAGAQTAGYGSAAPIPPEDARAIENLIDDQGELHFVITYPAQGGMPAHRTAFTHVEDQTAVNGTACTIVTRVMRQRESTPAAHYRSVFALGDVSHMQIMPMSAFSSSPRSPSSSANTPLNSVEPDFPVVVLDERGAADRGIFMFRSMEPARRFLAALQRLVPRCGGRNE